MTPLKQTLLGLITLVAIILLVGVLAIGHVDLSGHKPRIEQLVFDKTGRRLDINGPLNATVFPRLGFRLQDVTLGNAAGFSDPGFATAQSSEIQLKLLPLLTGKLRLKSLQLRGLFLKLSRDTDGKTNWDDLLSTTAVVETESDGGVVQEVEAGTPVVAALSIGDLRIEDSNFRYTDAMEDTGFALSEINLSADKIDLSAPFSFDSQFNFFSDDGAGIQSEVNASGELALYLADNRYHLHNLQLVTVNMSSALPIEQLPVTVEGELVAQLNSQMIEFDITDGNVLGIPISGELQIDGLQDDGWITGSLSSGEFDFANVLDQLGMESHLDTHSLVENKLLEKSSLSAQFVKFQDQLKINRVRTSLGDIEAEGDFQLTNLSGSPVFSGEFRTLSFNPSAWAQHIGLPAQDVLQRARLSTSVRQSGQLLSFNQLNLHIDDSVMTGDIEVSDITAGVPPITFALAIDQLELDRYLPGTLQDSVESPEDQTADPTEERTEDSTEKPTEESTEEPDEAPGIEVGNLVGTDIERLALLRELELSGEITVGELTVAGVGVQNMVLPILAQGGKISIVEGRADLHAGSFFSTASLDVQTDEPRLTMTGNLNGINFEPLVQDVLKMEAPLTGIANVNIDLVSRGFNQQQLLERASGAVSVRLTDGVVSGIDIVSELHQAGGLVNDLITESGVSSTPFSELSASALVTEGVMQSDDLVFNSEVLSITGEGGVNLVKHTVDYLMHIRVTDTQDDTGLLKELEGIELSVPVRGPFSDLSIDFKSLLLHAFESEFLEQIDNAKDRLLGRSAEAVDEAATRIESEKEALRDRLEQEREDAVIIIRDNKQQIEQEVETKKLEAEKQLQKEKDELKDKLQENLLKGIGDLLGEK